MLFRSSRLLRFEMVDTTLYFRPCVTAMREQFELYALPGGGTRITRTTEIQLRGFCKPGKGLLMWAGLKQVHRFVFQNWAAQVSRPV